jgi:hypothetical protein
MSFYHNMIFIQKGLNNEGSVVMSAVARDIAKDAAERQGGR